MAEKRDLFGDNNIAGIQVRLKNKDPASNGANHRATQITENTDITV